MKKFFTVLLWLGLAASLIALVSMEGGKNALREEAQRNQQKYETLKKRYDREKADWQSASAELSADNTALTLEKQALTAALSEAQKEMDTVKAERETLTAKNTEASGKLSDILAVLMPEEKREEEPPEDHLPQPAHLSRPEPLPM